MKGLIIKDLKLVFKNKVLIVLMALFSLVGFVGMDSSFMVGYFTLRGFFISCELNGVQFISPLFLTSIS